MAVRIASEYSVASQPGPYIASISDLIGQTRYDLVLPACGSKNVTVWGATLVLICAPVSSATRWPERWKDREACGSAPAIAPARTRASVSRRCAGDLTESGTGLRGDPPLLDEELLERFGDLLGRVLGVAVHALRALGGDPDTPAHHRARRRAPGSRPHAGHRPHAGLDRALHRRIEIFAEPSPFGGRLVHLHERPDFARSYCREAKLAELLDEIFGHDAGDVAADLELLFGGWRFPHHV